MTNNNIFKILILIFSFSFLFSDKKIKTKTEYCYTITQKFGKDIGALEYRAIYNYDSNGNKIEIYSYNSEGDLLG